jgi:hypothetical protein
MKPMNANNPADAAFELVQKVLGIPGRLQGMFLNAVVNTIDRAQTEAILRESAELQKQQQQEKKDGSST